MAGLCGGEGGIRTPDTGFGPYNGLANRRLQPLGHLSAGFVQQQFTIIAIAGTRLLAKAGRCGHVKKKHGLEE